MSNVSSGLNELRPQEAKQILSSIEREKARRRYTRSFFEFGREAFPIVAGQPFVGGKHFAVLVRHLEAVARKDDPIGHISRLLINLPPSTGKSFWVSQVFVPWIWTFWPSCRVMYFSYNLTRATKDSVAARTLIASKWYQEHFGSKFTISERDDTKTLFANSAGGYRQTSTIGGLATGEHPDIIIGDDVTSADQIKSFSYREGRRTWYFETISMRGIGRDCAHIINEQRFDMEDLSGHILRFIKKELAEYGSHAWHHVCLPMWFDPDHPYKMIDRGYGGDWRTTKGDLLFPELLSEATCQKARRALSAIGPWAALAQLDQNPSRRDGAHFLVSKIKLIERSELPICFDSVVRFWDFAGSEEEGACYTAGAAIGKKGSNYYLFDMQRDRLAGYEVEKLVEHVAKMDRLKYREAMGCEVRTRFEREGGATGKWVAERLEDKWRALEVLAIPPLSDKVSRSGPVASLIADGNFYVVEDVWTSAFIDEMQTFPTGEFKDQVDAVSGAIAEHLTPTSPGGGSGMAIAADDSDGISAFHPWGPCRCNCKRPAFDGTGYCCEKCRKTSEAGKPVEHTPQCAFAFNDWYVRNKRGED